MLNVSMFVMRRDSSLVFACMFEYITCVRWWTRPRVSVVLGVL